MISTELINATWAPKAEKQGSLTEEMLELIYREKWFKLFVPKEMDGLGLTLPEGLLLEEKIARLDASMGWTVTLCAGAGWFVGFLDEKLSQEIFSDPKVCLAGSGFVGGEANRVGDRYEISGSWTYASGALHATHFTANCEMWEEGKPMLNKDEKPLVKAFILKKEEVEILDGWKYMGMIATGSHAFKTENLRVPLNRVFEILPEKVTRRELIYRYPFLQFAEATLAVNILGITQHLQELLKESFWKRNEFRKNDQKQLKYFKKLEKKSSERLESHRKKFYRSVEESWEELDKRGKISKKSLKSVSLASRKLTQVCREVNARLYPFAGLEAAKTHTELNRVWRDFNTVSQHALLIFPF
jgi:alkylation response protein AidB-like acyl-CoA dehydrogenase